MGGSGAGRVGGQRLMLMVEKGRRATPRKRTAALFAAHGPFFFFKRSTRLAWVPEHDFSVLYRRHTHPSPGADVNVS